jgi:hypothetical protein
MMNIEPKVESSLQTLLRGNDSPGLTLPGHPVKATLSAVAFAFDHAIQQLRNIVAFIMLPSHQL